MHQKTWLGRRVHSVRKILWLVSERLAVKCSVDALTNPSLGVLAIMKNEAFNLREWVDHYKWQGVDVIFLIDNGSTDDSRQIIQAEIDSGYIRYFWRPKQHMQLAHCREIYELARIDEQVDWLCAADLDEFWYSPLGNLKAALRRLPEADVVYCPWRVFGSSGHVAHPASLRKSLVRRRAKPETQWHGKWICRTNRLVSSRAMEIHRVRWFDSRRVFVEDDLIRLNHYVTQSVQYFTEIKMTRGDAVFSGSEKVRDMKFFDQHNEGTSVLDTDLSDLLA